jgi:hypothetical protein
MSDAASRMLAWSEFSGTVRDSLRYTANKAAAASTNAAASTQRRRLADHPDGVLPGPVASSDGGSVSVPARTNPMERGV